MESRFSTPTQMRESVFFVGPEAPARYSRCRMLLVLSAIIASAGVVADSTAAIVIGYLIGRPLSLTSVEIGSKSIIERAVVDRGVVPEAVTLVLVPVYEVELGD